MKRLLLALLIIVSSISYLKAANDSIRFKIPAFVAVNAGFGSQLRNSDFITSEYGSTVYNSYSLKFGIYPYVNSWKDYVFGHPYIGIGGYVADFYRSKTIGVPVSIFLFQGAQLFNFGKASSLNYEFNLGYSFNWKPYDPFDNPDNNIIGSKTNIHFSASLYYKWQITDKLDLDIGGTFTHFSNGARHYPNDGMNMLGGNVQVAYHFNREKSFSRNSSPFEVPAFGKHVDHEFLLLITSRNGKLDTIGTGLSSRYTERNFKVLGLGYSYLFSYSYRYKWGPSIEFSYDESAGIKSWRQMNPNDGMYYDRIKLGSFGERLSLGVSMKGELVMPFYSFFANVGYDIIHANNGYKRFYQIIGLKFNLTDKLFLTAAVRATDFSQVQYLFLNVGYTIPGKIRKLKEYN